MKLTPEQRALYANNSGEMNGWSEEECDLFFEICERSELDPFSRQIWPMRREDKGQYRVSAGVTIDGFRIIASRSGKYRGQVGPFWCGNDGVWVDVWLHEKPPSAAKVGVLHADFTDTLWSVARFDDYAQRYKDGNLGPMWKKMGASQIAKCAEALGLRRAFPDRLTGLYTSDEMAQTANEPAAERPDFDPNKTKTAAKQSPIEKVKAAAAEKGINLGPAAEAKPVELYGTERAATLVKYLVDKAIDLEEIALILSEEHGIDPATTGGDLHTWPYGVHDKVRAAIKDILTARENRKSEEPPADQLDFANEE